MTTLEILTEVEAGRMSPAKAENELYKLVDKIQHLHDTPPYIGLDDASIITRSAKAGWTGGLGAALIVLKFAFGKDVEI